MSVCNTLRLFNTHVVTILVHIYINAIKHCLKQEQELVSWSLEISLRIDREMIRHCYDPMGDRRTKHFRVKIFPLNKCINVCKQQETNEVYIISTYKHYLHAISPGQ